MTRHTRSILATLMLGTLVVSLLGCSDGGTIETATLTDTATTAVGIALPDGAIPVDDPFSGGYPTYDDEATGLRVVFGTPDLGAGTSRVSFALFDDVGLISFPVLNVSTRFYPDGAEGDFQSGDGGQLRFYPFPQGSRGIYAGELSFPSAGLWALDVSVPQASGDTAHVVFPVEVAEALLTDLGDLDVLLGFVRAPFVRRFQNDGTLLASWGTEGTDPGEFQSASSVAVGSDGTIYVADYQLHRVQSFTPEGKLIAHWGQGGYTDGSFRELRGLAAWSDGTEHRVYTVDKVRNRVQVFASDGTFLFGVLVGNRFLR